LRLRSQCEVVLELDLDDQASQLPDMGERCRDDRVRPHLVHRVAEGPADVGKLEVVVVANAVDHRLHAVEDSRDERAKLPAAC